MKGISEFRLFCIAAFVAMGGYSAFSNHALHAPPRIENAILITAIGFVAGCVVITLFGRRHVD